MKIKVTAEMTGSKQAIEAWQKLVTKSSWLAEGSHSFNMDGKIDVETTHEVLEKDPLTAEEKVVELRAAIQDALSRVHNDDYPITRQGLIKALLATR